MSTADIFRALGDPVRLEMVQRLTLGRPCTIAALSSGLGISRQGARKHLQVLVEANLVLLEPKGRDVLVHLRPQALELAKEYFALIDLRWERRLEALKKLFEDS